MSEYHHLVRGDVRDAVHGRRPDRWVSNRDGKTEGWMPSLEANSEGRC